MTGHPAARLRRRQVLSAATVVAVTATLTGCEDVPLEASGAPATDDESAPADPDEALLADAVRAEAEMLAMLQPMLRRRPASIRQAAEASIAVHESHVDLLDEGRPVAPRTGKRTPTWRVVGAEEALARRHADAAVRASSGQFARVLASMSAAAAQQAEHWRRTTGTAS